LILFTLAHLLHVYYEDGEVKKMRKERKNYNPDLKAYMNDVVRYKLLTPEEEKKTVPNGNGR
jgi:hypothetical protein